jgi:penicillin-binding protein 2
MGIFAIGCLVLLVRLFLLQIVDDSYKVLAESNVIREMVSYPSRGLIFDRNGALLVQNEPVYDILVIPNQVKAMDTLKFCALLQITKESFIENLAKCRRYSRYRPSIFVRQLSPIFYAQIQERLYQFPGFIPQVRTIRNYPYHSAPHLLGYLGEVSPEQVEKSDYYIQGDYLGVNGIEKFYETQLRGTKGIKYVTVDVWNRETGSFKDGSFDVKASAGQDLLLSLDIDLQRYGEELFKNKRGALVAIEPSTGEILALISAPYYDPNFLTGRERGNNFAYLLQDTLKPLFNRALQAEYPPGSTLKPSVAAIAMLDGAISENTYYYCGRIWYWSGLTLHCTHDHPSCGNVQDALKESCNPYFWQTFRANIDAMKYAGPDNALDGWSGYMMHENYGKLTEIDLPGEEAGFVPTSAYYDKLYGKNRWGASTIISLAIGQGEFLATPLQMANAACIFANRGYYFKPHNVKSIGGGPPAENYRNPINMPYSRESMEIIAEGLHRVVSNGSGRSAKVSNQETCGKTGTAQNPHGEDHSLFMGFAPYENPKIAIAVMVENSGFGARYAAPIAGLMMEKYLNDSIPASKKEREERIMNANLLNVTEDDE